MLDAHSPRRKVSAWEPDPAATHDQYEEALSREDPEYYDALALVAMCQSRERMNQLRCARGFFNGRIDSIIDETAGGSGDMQEGRGKKSSKGRSSFRGGSSGAKGGAKCAKRKRPDHRTSRCLPRRRAPTTDRLDTRTGGRNAMAAASGRRPAGTH